MHRDAWPGFHPLFRGFGVEEGYIHEKARRTGGRTLCLPGLRWLHHFRDGERPPYPLRLEDPVFNLLVGHRELGIDAVKQIRASLAAPLTEHAFSLLVKQSESCQPWKGSPDMSCGCKQETQKITQPTSITKRFTQLHATASDMNEHMPLLRELAAGKSVADATGKEAVIVALISAEPARLTALAGTPENLAAMSLQTELSEGVDLLLETAETTYIALKERAEQVRKRIVVLGAARGFSSDLRRFIREHPKWSVWKHFTNNNGLTILSRDPEDKKPLPSIVKQAWNYAKATAEHVATGSKLADEATVRLRLETCDLCDQRNGNRCGVCGCFLDAHDGKEGKAMWAESQCPLGRW